jgi:hypothetical protein
VAGWGTVDLSRATLFFSAAVWEHPARMRPNGVDCSNQPPPRPIYGIVKLSEVGAVANRISLMRHI